MYENIAKEHINVSIGFVLGGKIIKLLKITEVVFICSIALGKQESGIEV